MNNRAFTVGGALALASALVLAPVAGSPAHAGVQQVNAPAVVAPAEISAEGAAHAQTILNRVNALRAEQGLKPVTRYTQLDSIAQDWSEQMSAAGQISHRQDFEAVYPAGWSSYSENVAMRSAGGDAGALLFEQWRNSPGHYNNMMDPDANAIGIGVAYNAAEGAWYATQNFGQYKDPAAAGLTETSAADQPGSQAPASPAPSPSAAPEAPAAPPTSAAPASTGQPSASPSAAPSPRASAPASATPLTRDPSAASTVAVVVDGTSRAPGTGGEVPVAAGAQPASTLPVTGASLIGLIVAGVCVAGGLILLKLRRRA